MHAGLPGTSAARSLLDTSKNVNVDVPTAGVSVNVVPGNGRRSLASALRVSLALSFISFSCTMLGLQHQASV